MSLLNVIAQTFRINESSSETDRALHRATVLLSLGSRYDSKQAIRCQREFSFHDNIATCKASSNPEQALMSRNVKVLVSLTMEV